MGHTGKKVFTQRKTKQTLETNRISEVGLPARTSNVYSVLSRENSKVAIKILGIVFFEALNDVSSHRLKCADVSGITLPFNYNP